MSEPKKTTGPKAIADVAHPGKSAPSDTSKPIITRRPMMKDPMVVEDNADKLEDTAKKPLSKQSGETKIEPPKPDKTTEEADAPSPKELDEKPAEPEPEAPDTDDQANKDKGKDKKPKQLEEEATAVQAKQDAKLQKIIDNKKYFLPINAVEQRRSKRFVVLGILLAVLLALAWVDIALDASLIKIGSVRPVTHFFSN